MLFSFIEKLNLLFQVLLLTNLLVSLQSYHIFFLLNQLFLNVHIILHLLYLFFHLIIHEMENLLYCLLLEELLLISILSFTPIPKSFKIFLVILFLGYFPIFELLTLPYKSPCIFCISIVYTFL